MTCFLPVCDGVKSFSMVEETGKAFPFLFSCLNFSPFPPFLLNPSLPPVAIGSPLMNPHKSSVPMPFSSPVSAGGLVVLLLCCTLTPSAAAARLHANRRVLHQPLSYPLESAATPAPLPTPAADSISQPPEASASPPRRHPRLHHVQPEYPFSSQSQSPPGTPLQPVSFFPTISAPPPPEDAGTPSFPANISSLVLPRSSSSNSGRPISRKLVALIVAVALVFVALLTSLVAFLLNHRDRDKTYCHHRTDNLRLVPPNTTLSDADFGDAKKKSPPPPPPLPRYQPSAASTSSEFLYLGTLFSSRELNDGAAQNQPSTAPGSMVPSNGQVPGSPELRPLPPLPRPHFLQTHRNSGEVDDEDEFFSPRNSPHRNSCTARRAPDVPVQDPTSFPLSNSSSPTASLSASPTLTMDLNLSPRSLRSKSPDSLAHFPAPRLILNPPPTLPAVASLSSGDTHNSPSRASDSSAQVSDSLVADSRWHDSGRVPTPPPPPPPPRGLEPPATEMGGPPVLVAPSRPGVSKNGNEDASKPKLKPLHWDKVKSSSDRVMIWDQLRSCSNSFQLNEEMIESLFIVNPSSNPYPKHTSVQENRVLDPKKSQNISILLRALYITVEEVCEALVEGNADSLGAELLESLLKMAPTKEEERKLMEFKDESPSKLCPAEKFLKAVLDIPFAFRRVDAMLYIANFDSDVEYLKRSFETLEVACQELRKSRMFKKLLEAVLKTGNRMNVGTNRGDARAFKLDTLLKLADVKGTDGKTTLLHFVVLEIVRAEGSRLSGQKPDAEKQLFVIEEEVEFRKVGLQVVSGLSGELMNVKKAAGMDSDVLINEVAKLADGVSKITQVVKLNDGGKNKSFTESMNTFLKKAEVEIIKIQAQESVAMSMVKELTEYFHGNLAKEEARPLRVFMVVKDFLCVLDQVCKDVGKINERTIVSSGRQFPIMPALNVQVFPGYMDSDKQRDTSSSSDDDSSSSTV